MACARCCLGSAALSRLRKGVAQSPVAGRPHRNCPRWPEPSFQVRRRAVLRCKEQGTALRTAFNTTSTLRSYRIGTLASISLLRLTPSSRLTREEITGAWPPSRGLLGLSDGASAGAAAPGPAGVPSPPHCVVRWMRYRQAGDGWCSGRRRRCSGGAVGGYKQARSWEEGSQISLRGVTSGGTSGSGAAWSKSPLDGVKKGAIVAMATHDRSHPGDGQSARTVRFPRHCSPARSGPPHELERIINRNPGMCRPMLNPGAAAFSPASTFHRLITPGPRWIGSLPPDSKILHLQVLSALTDQCLCRSR